jgi:glycosyltransferase involved in cell wall biosynthesis
MSAIRVLYSFPHRLGAMRICHTAWQQVEQASLAGAKMTVLCTSVARPVNYRCRVKTTLSLWRVRVPVRLVGRERCLAFHDRLTARWLSKNHQEIDIVHAWPGAAMKTIAEAKKHGIPCVLERPNAHTAYAFEAAAEEAERCGIGFPKGHDHAFDGERLKKELSEYSACDFLLCPSEFVVRTFLERNTSEAKILRHRYGFDPERFFPSDQSVGSSGSPKMTAIFVGVCEPRKGLHYILEAWHTSGVRKDCQLLICGKFVPGYAEKLQLMLDHPSIKLMGHRDDIPEQMRQADVFLLSSVEEGSALVTYEAIGSGCVLLVSDATGAPVIDGETALIHPMRNVSRLAGHLAEMRNDTARRKAIRARSIGQSKNLTWLMAGNVTVDAYRSAIETVRGLS